MSTLTRVQQNWKLIVLLVAFAFAGSPLAVGLVFKESALPYFSYTITIVVCAMIVAVMGFTRGGKSSTAKSTAVVEYCILLTAFHIVGGVAFCLDSVAMLKDISAASMFVFVFIGILLIAKIDTLK